MDFKTLVPGAGGAAAVAADALLVVVGGDAVPAALPKALATACQQLVRDGDFDFKAGRTAWTAGVDGVKARRVVFAWAADVGVSAFRKAVAAGLGLLKGGGAAHVAVLSAGAAVPGAAAAVAWQAVEPMARLGKGKRGIHDRAQKSCAGSQVAMPGRK